MKKIFDLRNGKFDKFWKNFWKLGLGLSEKLDLSYF